MNEEVQMVMEVAADSMKSSVQHLADELVKVRAGKANPGMLDGVMVEYYGTMTPLNQVSNVNTPDGRTLTIQPWEKGMLEPIEKAIVAANLGLNPQNNGDIIIINVPTLTEERRQQLLKKAKAEGENAKVSIRNARKEANDEIKKLKNAGLPEDVSDKAEQQVQGLTNKYTDRVDKLIDDKEKDILTV